MQRNQRNKQHKPVIEVLVGAAEQIHEVEVGW